MRYDNWKKMYLYSSKKNTVGNITEEKFVNIIVKIYKYSYIFTINV